MTLRHELYFSDCLTTLPELTRRYGGQVRLVYLDPPYNTGRRRRARKHFGDRAADWRAKLAPAVGFAFELLADDGFLAVSINQKELFNLKSLIDEVFSAERFVGLFPVKIRHSKRQLMINATYHDVFEYLLIYRKHRSARFETTRKPPRMEKFNHRIELLDPRPQRQELNGKRVEIYQPGQYAVSQCEPGEEGLRRYVIAGKLATANWSGEWYESHLRPWDPTCW